MVIFCVIFLIAVVSAELWNFFRKKRFYDRIATVDEELDKKYLLSELVGEPDFYEGRLLKKVICDADKAMCDEVAAYRRETSEFREYIELWVHEVKLPVSSLLLMCKNNPESGERYAGEVRRIDKYVENVLFYARSEDAAKDYIIRETSLRRVFADAALEHREELLMGHVDIEADIPDIQVMTDAKWLQFIIGQVLSNSLKYSSTERTPEIRVSAEKEENLVILKVHDNGIGISAEDLPYIFEKSFTGANGRLGAKSTGMGLFIARRLCEKLGHRISAASVVGEFTEITIEFVKNDYYKNVI